MRPMISLVDDHGPIIRAGIGQLCSAKGEAGFLVGHWLRHGVESTEPRDGRNLRETSRQLGRLFVTRTTKDLLSFPAHVVGRGICCARDIRRLCTSCGVAVDALKTSSVLSALLPPSLQVLVTVSRRNGDRAHGRYPTESETRSNDRGATERGPRRIGADRSSHRRR